MNILQMLNRSEYIQLNNQLIKPEFSYAAEDSADDDDVAISCDFNGRHLEVTVAELEDARPLADGGYWLEGVGYLRFVPREALH